MTKPKPAAGTPEKAARARDKSTAATGKPAAAKRPKAPKRAEPFALYSLSTLSTELHMERATIVRKFGAAGVVPAGKVRGHPAYRLADAFRALAQSSEAAPGTEQRPPSSAERAQHYAAELKRIELETKQRLLVPAVEVEDSVVELVRNFTSFLAGLTDRVERDAELTPQQTVKMLAAIDSGRRDLHARLRRLFGPVQVSPS